MADVQVTNISSAVLTIQYNGKSIVLPPGMPVPMDQDFIYHWCLQNTPFAALLSWSGKPVISANPFDLISAQAIVQ